MTLATETLELTPATLRALGEGVQRLRDGDLDDCTKADEVVEAMRAMGYRLGGYEFVKCTRFTVLVGKATFATTESEMVIQGTLAQAAAEHGTGQLRIWDHDDHRYRDDLVAEFMRGVE